MTLTLADEPALAGIPADELRMDLACGMYREGKITSVTAAHLAGVGIVRFQEELRNRSIPGPMTQTIWNPIWPSFGARSPRDGCLGYFRPS